MPPILIPPLVKFAFGALGAAAVVHWAVKQTRRLNEEIERVRAASTIDPATRRTLPTLRRDPRTDEWRVRS